MTQLEQDFRLFLSKNPEIEMCYSKKLINRRSLARYLIKKGIGKQNQIEAMIAMLRRFNFNDRPEINPMFFRDTKIQLKDNILVFDFEKDKQLLKFLQNIVSNTNYDQGDTLKIVLGSNSIKVFIDKKYKNLFNKILEEYKLNTKIEELTELSILFNQKASQEKGILAIITQELAINNIIINELLTATPELIFYIQDKYVLKTLEILKRLQKS